MCAAVDINAAAMSWMDTQPSEVQRIGGMRLVEQDAGKGSTMLGMFRRFMALSFYLYSSLSIALFLSPLSAACLNDGSSTKSSAQST